MFAIIESGGKQHKVSKGDSLQVELLDEKEGTIIEFNAKMIADGKNSQIGTPILEDTRVIGKILRHGRSGKVKVFKMKRRKGYRRTAGHRQNFTEILIEDIKL